MNPNVRETVTVANVDCEGSQTSEEERTRARAASLTSSMAKQGDDDQRKIRSSSLRTQRLPVRLLRLVLDF
jgi:hypothetical protein